MAAESSSATAQHLFGYPDGPLNRKHGPRGYVAYQSFKPWLRDEFEFRCIYCLSRERWFPDGDSSFGSYHIIPQSVAIHLVCVYENLVYACSNCNSFRQDRTIPIDFESESIADHIEVGTDGELVGTTEKGVELIDKCQLNRGKLVAFRKRFLLLVKKLDADLEAEVQAALEDFLMYPDDLPDLAKLRPPEGNSKPDGLLNSFFATKNRGDLPNTY